MEPENQPMAHFCCRKQCGRCSTLNFKLHIRIASISCTCSSLIALNLRYWLFDKETVIAWNSLKTLKLHVNRLDDDDIVKLLSACPALETIELTQFQGFRRLDINSSNLKTLRLNSYTGDGPDDALAIFASHLQHLELTGDFGCLRCRLVNVSSLVTANLTFHISCINIWNNFSDDLEDSCREFHQVYRNLVLDYIQKLTYATELIIGSWFAKVVLMLQLEGVPLPELRWKCLTLEMHTEYIFYGVASLLQTSPFLETLNVDMVDWFHDFHCQLERSYLAKGDNINLLSWMSNIALPNLKNVKIAFTTSCLKGRFEGGSDKLFELSEFLLKNAMALKKFVIVPETRICWKCSERCVSQYLARFGQNLLDSPRSSKNLMIIFQ